ncbi:MAG: hypothetical protein IJF47_02335 [Candidatus Methanomethylophilaceae archaeon]|nr:hypothetical protein [Candidatus Methanomethylophilaceae archaeon]
MELMSFLTIAVFAFAFIMLLAGLFTAYFGTGKSRKMGIVLLLVGLIVGGVWAYLVGFSDIEMFKDIYALDLVIDSLVNLVAIIVGAIVAVGIFLVAVMKS